MRIVKRLAVCLGAVCAAASAWAANDGAADPGLLLDALRTDPTAEAAAARCGRDRVVWADRYAGYYYRQSEPSYGSTAEGAFACLRDARAARYWSTDPIDRMEGHPGRTFPFDPYLGS